MSNRLFQSVVHQLKDSIDRTIGIIDDTATIIACSELDKIGESFGPNVAQAVSVGSKTVCADNYTFKAIGDPVHPENAVFVSGDDEQASSYAGLIAVFISNLKQFYDEKYNKANFVKNVILDNILPGDIMLKARELNFNSDATRAVLVVRINGLEDASVFDVIGSLFPDKSKDFIININDTDLAIVKEVMPNTEIKDLEKLARSVADFIGTEYYTRTSVGIGTCVQGVRELGRSFKEANVALEVGKVFDTEKNIVSYENLGIARLIYQLPTTLCEAFLKEVFKRGSIDSLDKETLFTIQKFFENNLNVSETSRKLFVHRNTLVYRLDKIHKLTGLDLREFDDAIVFKVALMVNKYLEANPVKY